MRSSCPKNRISRNYTDCYATAGEFQRLFAIEMRDFYHLALLLTADCEQAEQCIILAMNDCFSSSAVFQEWMRIWARRAVIRNAIQLVANHDSELPAAKVERRDSQFGLSIDKFPMEVLSNTLMVLSLPPFERIVFVICSVEHYCIQDCAMLLCKSPRDVREALARARDQIENCNMQQPNIVGDGLPEVIS